MKGFYKIDLDMITKVSNLVDKQRKTAESVEERDDLNFIAGYLEGLKIRIEENLVMDKRHVSKSHL